MLNKSSANREVAKKEKEQNRILDVSIESKQIESTIRTKHEWIPKQ